MNEISTPEMYSTIGIFTNIGMTIGFLYSYLIGAVVVPYSDQYEPSDCWWVVFGAGIPIALICLVLILTVFKEESPVMNQSQILIESKDNLSINHSYSDMIFNPWFWLMTFLSSFIAFTGVLNGIDALLIYSTKIFEVGEGSDSEWNGRYLTILMGAI